MKNLSLFLLLCLLFAACAKDENKEPILVTDIVMPTQGPASTPVTRSRLKHKVFKPMTT